MLPLVEIGTREATPDVSPTNLGLDEWPGGNIVHIGSTTYPDGVYSIGDPERDALVDPTETNWLEIRDGRQSFNVFPSGGTRGERGPMFWLELPDAGAAIDTVFVYARHLDGYLFDEDEEDGPNVSFPLSMWRTYSDNPFGGLFSIYTRPLTTRLGAGHFRLGYPTHSLTSGDLLSFEARVVPESQRGRWRVYHVEIGGLTPQVTGVWPLRQRQSLAGAPGWPLRQRQSGGATGSWALRQRQRGV